MDTIEAIKTQVPMSAILTRYNVDFMGGGFAEQLSCPFGHRPDINKSARYYPDSETIYCFTCGKTWDVVEAVKDAEGVDTATACKFLAEWYNVTVDAPTYVAKLHVIHKSRKQQDLSEFAKSVAIMLIKQMREELTQVAVAGYRKELMQMWSKLDNLMISQVLTMGELASWYDDAKAFIHRLSYLREGGTWTLK